LTELISSRDASFEAFTAVMFQVEVFLVMTPSRWRDHGLLKLWYPTTTRKTSI